MKKKKKNPPNNYPLTNISQQSDESPVHLIKYSYKDSSNLLFFQNLLLLIKVVYFYLKFLCMGTC